MSPQAAPKIAVKQAAPARAAALEVRPARDRFEQEADHAAAATLRSGTANASPPALSLLPSVPDRTARPAPASVSAIVGSAGASLPARIREDMERRFRSDFSRVRIHTGPAAAASARAIDATAYTSGESVVFGDSAFAPLTPRGRHLLAHELAHVVQQRGAAPHAVQRRCFVEDIGIWLGVTEGNFTDIELHAYLTKITEANAKEDSYDSDNKARAIVRLWKTSNAGFKLDPLQKALLILEMQAGPTGDEDEKAILDLLELSDIAALRIMFGEGKLSVTELESDLDDDSAKRLQAFFNTRFEGGRDALAKGTVAPKGMPGKDAPAFNYDIAELKKRIDAVGSSRDIDLIAAEIFALAPATRDKATKDLSELRAEAVRKVDELEEKADNTLDSFVQAELKQDAKNAKITSSKYDVVLSRVYRDIALTVSGKDLSNTVAPNAAQKAEIAKALKPEVRTDDAGGTTSFDQKQYEDSLRKLIPDMIQRYWDRHVKGRGPEEHDDKTKTRDLTEFERIAKASKDETDKVFAGYYTRSDHPEFKAGPAEQGGRIHDRFADLQKILDDPKTPRESKQKDARGFLFHLLRSDQAVRNLNRTFNVSPAFNEQGPVNDAAKILDKLATEFTGGDKKTAKIKGAGKSKVTDKSKDNEQTDKLNEIRRGWDAGAGPGALGSIDVQIFKKDIPEEDRDLLWDSFQSLIHEYIHTLRSGPYTAYANSFGDGPEYNTLMEGVDNLLDEVVWENVAPRVQDPALRLAVEGPVYAKEEPINVISASRRRYPSHAEAMKLVGIVGIRNLYAAYFQGDIDKIGGDITKIGKKP
ncbi:eCIS core domain-containing protein [Bradyrhizobium sp. 930_D9_N1_4]|uniref:eCIS core domain-containing protein n=1 Tax=Bradyrhizobium sp. 930_D9_N1_4 TaxID=3240374 RepID=UPI003F8A6EC7